MHIKGKNRYTKRILTPAGYKEIRLGKTKDRPKPFYQEMENGLVSKFAEEMERLKGIEGFKNMIVSQLLNIWMVNHSQIKRNKKSQDGDRYIIVVLNRFFGEMNIQKLSHKDINNYMEKRRLDVSYRARQEVGVTERTIHCELRLLKQAFDKARTRWDMTHNDPFMKVDMPKFKKGRVRFLKDWEEQAIVEVVENRMAKNPGFKWFNRIWYIARASGIRISNLCELTLDDVDTKKGGFYIKDTKNDEPYFFAWSKEWQRVVYEIMAERGHLKRTDRFFVDDRGKPLTRNRVSQEQLEICREAGVEDYRWHDNRHDFASSLANEGSTLFEIMEALGQKDIKSAQIYAHLVEDKKRETVERIPLRYNPATRLRVVKG